MHGHDLIDAMAYGQIELLCEHPTDRELREVTALNRRLADQVRAAHHFAFGNLDTWDVPELKESAGEAIGDGEFLLPYPTIWCDGHDGGCPATTVGALIWQETPGVGAMIFSRRPHGQWVQYPFGYLVDGEGVKMRTPLSDRSIGRQVVEFGAHTLGPHLMSFLAALEALASMGVKRSLIEAPSKLNVARVKRGREPVHDYWVLRVDVPGRARQLDPPLGHGHNPPRPHFRRAHRRRRAGEPDTVKPTIKVRCTLVGLGSSGFVENDYRVRKRG